MLDNLIKWEKENGFKAKYVAEKLGLTESQYSKLKSGKLKPSIEVAYLLHKEFGIDDVFIYLIKEGRVF